MALLLISLQLSAVSSWSVRSKNNKAVDKFENKEFSEANNMFLNAGSESESIEPIVLFNLASSYVAIKELESAKKTFHLLAELLKQQWELNKDHPLLKELLFKTYFNLAVIAQAETNFEDAIKNYQLALDIEPEDFASKFNIESMLQQDQSKQQGQNKDKKEQKDKNQDQKDDPKSDGKQKKDQQPQPSKGDQKKEKKKRQKPKFDSKEMSKQDLKRILKELKRQEENIRAKMNRKSTKEQGLEKDW